MSVALDRNAGFPEPFAAVAAAMAIDAEAWPHTVTVRTDEVLDRSLERAAALARPHEPDML